MKKGIKSSIKGEIFIFVLVMAVLASGCSKGNPKGGNKNNNAPIPVRVVTAIPSEIRSFIEYATVLKGFDEAMVFPRVPGKIMEKKFEEGAIVKKGDAIAFIDRDEVGLKYEPSPVEAPINGIITKVFVDRGQLVTPQTPVAHVADISKMKAKIDVSEKYLSLLNTQMTAVVEVDTLQGNIFTSRVFKISPMVDEGTRTVAVEILVNNPDGILKSGMFGRATIVLEEKKNAIVLPREAVIGYGEDVFVYVIENDIAMKKKVQIGLREGSNVEIKGGVAAGDKVVVIGQQRLKDGSKVFIENGLNGVGNSSR